jgi:hypothetical protein
MIAPKIPLVQDGQILSVGLVNSLIGRTEYAADLLRQYKLIAGDNISIERQFDGTRINAELVEAAKFRIVGSATVAGVGRAFVYDGLTFTDIFVPGSAGAVANDIDGSNIVGFADFASGTPYRRGFLYNGSTFTDIVFPGISWNGPFIRGTMRAQGIDGSNITGTYQDNSFKVRGFLYNGSTYTNIIADPLAVFNQTTVEKISGSNIVGTNFSTSPPSMFIYDGATFTYFSYPGAVNMQAVGIDGSNIVGSAFVTEWIGFLYDGTTFTDIIYPGATRTFASGIYGSNIVGTAVVGGVNRGFLYDGSTFTDIIYPGASSTGASGIG